MYHSLSTVGLHELIHFRKLIIALGFGCELNDSQDFAGGLPADKMFEEGIRHVHSFKAGNLAV